MSIVHQGNPPDAAAFAATQNSFGAGANHLSSIDIERILRADRTAGGHPISTTDWKLVAEGLPDDDILVLIALNDDDVWAGYRDGDIWRYVDAMPITSERVTHWMPLPAHPGAA